MDFNNYIEFIKEKHKGQKRIQGTPYYEHPLKVSQILKEKGLSQEYQIVGLFHDLLEDTNTTNTEILELTNIRIAEAVQVLTKQKNYNMSEYIAKIKQNEIAKMVKLADRIHNLSEAHFASIEFQNKYIKETEEWYIDLAKDTVFEEQLKNILEKLIQSTY